MELLTSLPLNEDVGANVWEWGLMLIALKVTLVVPSKSLVGEATTVMLMLQQLTTSGHRDARDHNDITAI
ncbi:MAG: hypothetical protein ABJQ90_18765 [Parasphingorhabdus sp.]